MATIKKLLLVRLKQVKPTVIEEMGMGAFAQGDPIPVSPIAWEEEAGLSHYAYQLEGFKLKELKELEAAMQTRHQDKTLLSFTKETPDVGSLLATVGLRINTLA